VLLLLPGGPVLLWERRESVSRLLFVIWGGWLSLRGCKNVGVLRQ